MLDGMLLTVSGDGSPVEAPAGSMFTAPRGARHTFSNPTDQGVRVLGLWSPAALGLAFIKDVGAVLPATGPPDAALMAAVYERRASTLLP